MGEQAFLKLKQEKYHETTAPERSSYGINSQTSLAWLCRQKANHSKSEHPPPPPPHAQVLSSLISESHNWKQAPTSHRREYPSAARRPKSWTTALKGGKGVLKQVGTREDSSKKIRWSDWIQVNGKLLHIYIYTHIHIYTHIKP